MANKIYDTIWYESWRRFYNQSLMEDYHSLDNDEDLTLTETKVSEEDIEQEIIKIEKQFKKSIQKLKSKVKDSSK